MIQSENLVVVLVRMNECLEISLLCMRENVVIVFSYASESLAIELLNVRENLFFGELHVRKIVCHCNIAHDC